MASTYKAQKEAFVSGLTGGSIDEINAVTCVAPAAIFFWSVLQKRFSFFEIDGLAQNLTDFLLNCCGILFAITIYSDYVIYLNLLLCVPAISAYFVTNASTRQSSSSRKSIPNGARDGSRNSKPKERSAVKPFITHYRGTMLIVTCAAILAVDFQIFPRRFAKVETWGTSLMDVGVGAFVFSAGIVGARPLLKSQNDGIIAPFFVRVRTAIRHAFPLVVLGFIRLLSVKGVDYAEHVTEYGVHWNFFFTMAFIPLSVTLLQSLVPSLDYYWLLSLLVAVFYQVLLDSSDLTAYILTATRDNLLSQNREGVFSSFGYLSIFLAGQATGLNILPRSPYTFSGRRSSQAAFKRPELLALFKWTVIWSVLYLATTSYHGAGVQVSRRLANLPYVLWTAAFSTFQLLLFCSVETFVFGDVHNLHDLEQEAQQVKQATSKIIAAFNRNGLALFLVANLLTGLVNLTLPTISMGPLPSMAVLTAYMASLGGLALALDRLNISLKF